jgi:hypothetical protein
MRSKLLVATLLLATCARKPDATGDDAPDTVVADTDVADTGPVDLSGCALEPTAADCRDCCVETRPSAAETLMIAVLAGCACVQGNAPCNDVCLPDVGDACDGTHRSDDCSACLARTVHYGTDQCLGISYDLCESEVPRACGPVLACVRSCDALSR